jgi:hypothetical protein
MQGMTRRDDELGYKVGMVGFTERLKVMVAAAVHQENHITVRTPLRGVV